MSVKAFSSVPELNSELTRGACGDSIAVMRLRPHEPTDQKLIGDLQKLVGSEYVSTNNPTRMAYSRDMWPRSLLRQRLGAINSPPGIVVWPRDTDEVARVVRVAVEHGTTIVPFGAGSGVCGGTLPLHGGIVLDLKRLNKILSLVDDDHLLEAEAGCVGEILERELNRRGWTLGHFPSSIYCSTLGGWLAGRSAGQCSSLYGKIEDMCRSVTWVDSHGKSQDTLLHQPGYSSWSLAPLLLGSEGTLGVITSAKLVVRPLPQTRWYCGYRFSSIEDGTRAMRQILRQGLRPSVLRLYDEFDSLIAKTGSTADLPEQQVKDKLVSELLASMSAPLRLALRGSIKRILQAPRLLNSVAGLLPNGCLMVVVHEGHTKHMNLVGSHTDDICRKNGAQSLGQAPARYWWEHRYGVSYKQSTIFSAGGFVDTMEVSCTWDRLARLYHSVKTSLKGLVFTMAHFSHAYRDGCSIYFTFAGAAKDDVLALDLYDKIWDAAQKAVYAAGGTVSHHHGVGLSKARFLVRQLGPAQVLNDSVKHTFDPVGVFNPGKLGQTVGTLHMPIVNADSMGLDDLLSKLKVELGSQKVLSADEAFAAVPMIPSPLAVLRPTSTQDVSKCLVIARDSGTKVVVRGHGSRIVKNLSKRIFSDYLLLDMSSLTGVVEVNLESLWARVRAGTPLSALLEQTMEAGCRPVGVNANSLGTVGGWLCEHTKVPDAIMGIVQPATNSIEAVLASGQVVRSAQTPRSAVGPDLFSVLVGTGGGFGAITSACLKLEPLPAASRTLSARFSSVAKALALVRYCFNGLVHPSSIIVEIKGKSGRRTAKVSILLEGHEYLVRAASDSITSQLVAMGSKCKQAAGTELSQDLICHDSERIIGGNLEWSRVQKVLRRVDVAFGAYKELVIDRVELTGCRVRIVVRSDGENLDQPKTWMNLLDPNAKKRTASQNDARWMQRLREHLDPDCLLNPHAWPLRQQEREP